MLNKVFRRDFCEEVIFEIQRTRKNTFEKWRNEPFKQGDSMCKCPVAVP